MSINKSKSDKQTEQVFEIAVIATMSSGKSTLINALLGKDLLPVANAATTAKICRIRDRDGQRFFWVQCRNEAGRVIDRRTKATPKLLEAYNRDEKISLIEIDGDIPAIAGSAARLCFVDTPGPNNSVTQEHRKIMQSVLRDKTNKPLILFVLDATKPEDESEAALLEEVNLQLQKSKSDVESRIVFVLNKADVLDTRDDADGSMDEILKRYREYLQRLNFPDAPIFPLSADAALLLRRTQNGEQLSIKESAGLAFYREACDFDRYAALPEICRHCLDDLSSLAKTQEDDDAQMLIKTGIVGLELYISSLLPKISIKSNSTPLLSDSALPPTELLAQHYLKQPAVPTVSIQKKEERTPNMNLKICYNPYQMKSSFFIDSEPVSDNVQWVEYLSDRRLQSWFFPGSNWAGLGDELAKYLNETAVTISFEGREVDFLDLKAYFEEYARTGERKTRFEIQTPSAFGKDIAAVRRELDSLIKSCEASPAPEMKSEGIRRAYENAIDGEFDMAVIATMSSGKSTLINALLGEDLLPARNEATTAKITRISDKDGAKTFEVVCRDEDENVIIESQIATPNVLEEYNSNKDVFYIDMVGDIPGISNENLRLRILDTPGPNNSATSAHRAVTESVIQDRIRQPVILYVMDASKLQDDSDANLLKRIAGEISKFGKEAQDRFIFVINRADVFEEAKDGPIEAIVRKQQEYLRSFGILSNQIIPLSAEAAKLLRLTQRGEQLSKKSKFKLTEELAEANFDQASILTPTCRAQLEQKKRQAEETQDQMTLDLIATGIIGLELSINEYLSKYAYPYKINRAVSNFRLELGDSNMMTGLAEKLSQDEKALAKVQGELEQAKIKQAALSKKREALSSKTCDIVLSDDAFSDIEMSYNRLIDVQLRNLLSEADENQQIPLAHKNQFFREVNGLRSKLLSQMEVDSVERIEELINRDFNPVILEYQEALKEIQLSFDISGYSPNSAVSFQQLKERLSNIQNDDLCYDTSFVGDRNYLQKYHVQNPKRKGILGFFKFWEPADIECETTVVYHDVLDASKVFMAAVDKTRNDINDCMRILNETCSELYGVKKKFCLELLKQYDDTVQRELARLEELTDVVRNKELDVNATAEKMRWLKQTTDKLDHILSMENAD